jgi:hypothetical protein
MQKSDFIKIANKLSVIFDKKNKLYGDGYFKEPEQLARYYGGIYRKSYRLNEYMKNLMHSIKNDESFETLEETYKDLAIYVIMELMLMEQNKTEVKNNEK